MVNIWAKSSGVTAADNTTGTALVGSFVQQALNNVVRQAKINNQNYAVFHLELSLLDEQYPWLFNKKKVLNTEFHFNNTELIPPF